jgi:hypothetical protein
MLTSLLALYSGLKMFFLGMDGCEVSVPEACPCLVCQKLPENRSFSRSLKGKRLRTRKCSKNSIASLNRLNKLNFNETSPTLTACQVDLK